MARQTTNVGGNYDEDHDGASPDDSPLGQLAHIGNRCAQVTHTTSVPRVMTMTVLWLTRAAVDRAGAIEMSPAKGAPRCRR